VKSGQDVPMKKTEEAGMDYCASWMRSFIDGIPIRFIPAGDPFQD
jgi:hypothetical protein